MTSQNGIQAEVIPSTPDPGPRAGQLPSWPPPRRGKRLLTFLCVFLVGAGLTLGYAVTRPRIYQSNATLRVYPSVDRATDSVTDGGSITSRPAQTLLSRPVLAEVLERLPGEPPISQTGAADVPDEIAALRTSLAVTEASDANLLELSAQGPNRMLLPQVVNHWLDVYLEHDESLRSKTDDSTNRVLLTEHEVLRQRVEDKRNELDEFRRTYDIQSMQREDNVVASRLRGINRSLDTAKERLADSEGRLRSLRQAIASGKPIGTRQEWQTVVQLEGRVTELREQATQLESKFTPEYIAINPEMRAVIDQLELVEGQLAEKRKEVERGALFAAEQDLESARATVQTLQRELDEHKQKSETFSARFAELETLQRELDELELRARDLDQRMLDQEVSRTSGQPKPEVLERASVPTLPISPNYPQVAGIGLGASFVLALLAVWIREYLTRPDATAEAGANVFYSVVDARSLPLVQAPSTPESLTSNEEAAAQLTSESPDLSDRELHSLIAVADDSTKLLIMLLLSGASAKEASKLRWRDLGAESVRVSTRGDADRELPMSPGVRAVYERIRGESRDESYLWHDASGTPLAESELDALVVYAAHDAELPRPSAVDTRALRHAHITYLVREGVRLGELDRVVGYLAPSDKLRYRSLSPSTPTVAVDDAETVHPAARSVDAA